jgi:anti-sigma factor ChrR (cupin superfamily)
MSKPDHLELAILRALDALPAGEVPAVEAHVAACAECQQELATVRPVVDALVSWPTEVLRPSGSLWDRLTHRIAAETGQAPLVPAPPRPAEPDWEEASPGVFCKVLATDTEEDRVSMLVRLAPGAAYPPHRHAGVEELHLVDGELIVDDKHLYPGDYLRSELGSVDRLVRSETGCTCVLLTSTRDVVL